MTGYRILGTSNDVTDCQAGPHHNLKMTVALQPLDADGNDDGDPWYVGTGCAATILGRTGRGRSAEQKILAEARAADRAARELREWEEQRARYILDAYTPVLTDQADRSDLYRRFWANNPSLRAARTRGETTATATTEIPKQIEWARTVLPDYTPITDKHRITPYRTTDGRRELWAFSCTCGRRGHLPDVYGPAETALAAASAIHDDLQPGV